MKLVIQRVARASVTVDGKVVSSVNQGLCVLVGITRNDTDVDASWAVRKLASIRLFDDPADAKKSWAKNVLEVNGDILLVSQFTLCHVLKGNKPDFHNAMKGPDAKVLFDRVVADLRSLHKPEKVLTGEFGAHMNVGIENDGPVTIVLDTKDFGDENSKGAKVTKNTGVNVAACAASPSSSMAEVNAFSPGPVSPGDNNTTSPSSESAQ